MNNNLQKMKLCFDEPFAACTHCKLFSASFALLQGLHRVFHSDSQNNNIGHHHYIFSGPSGLVRRPVLLPQWPQPLRRESVHSISQSSWSSMDVYTPGCLLYTLVWRKQVPT